MPLTIIDPATTLFATAFLFVFAVVFGLLSVSDVLKSKYVNLIIAAVFGVFAASSAEFAAALQAFVPPAAAILIVLFFFVFIKKLFGKEEKDMLPVAVTLASLLALLGVFGDVVASFVPGVAPDTLLWLMGITIVLLIFYAVYRHKQA